MKSFLIVLTVLTAHTLHAQEYGWQVIARPRTQLSAVEFVDSLYGWTAEGASQMFRTTDGGSTWTPYDAAAGFVVSTISMLDTAVGWAVGSQSLTNGKIIRTTNGGRNWTLQHSVINRVYVGSSTFASIENISSGYAVNSPDTGKVVQTTSAGTTWTERTIADSITRLTKVQFVDSLHGWIAATYRPSGSGSLRYAVLRTVEGGATWEFHRTPDEFSMPTEFSAICFIDTLHGWATSHSFQVFRTTDGGITWDSTYFYSPGSIGIDAISFVDSVNGWVFGGRFYQGGMRETIFRTSDGGYTWIEESVGLSEPLQDGLMLDRYHGWAVAHDGRVLKYRQVTSVPERLQVVPKAFALHQNYPNPFNPSTTIEYEVINQSHVAIEVLDALGKRVVSLVDQLHEPAPIASGSMA